MKKLIFMSIFLFFPFFLQGAASKQFSESTNNGISVGGVSFFNLTSSMTITAWSYTTGSAGADMLVTKKSSTVFPFNFRKTGTEELCFGQSDALPASELCTTGAPINLNTWQHFAAVRTGSQSVVLYINGVLVAGPSTLTDVPTGNSSNVTIGTSTFDASSSWGGNIMDVRIYNRNLTQDEVNISMRCLSQPNNGIIGHWLLMDDGDTNIDLSGNNNAGTCPACPTNSHDGPPTAWCGENH